MVTPTEEITMKIVKNVMHAEYDSETGDTTQVTTYHDDQGRLIKTETYVVEARTGNRVVFSQLTGGPKYMIGLN